jgi:hypothetical protein|tara:strand:+ start:589 stop:759 length:171 start_codon:yes stop_codon:yes gene_type:complete
MVAGMKMIPTSKKDVRKKSNRHWLLRNLKVNNSDDPYYGLVIDELQSIASKERRRL